MRDIKLFYWLDMPNFGDALNIDICRKLFNVNPIKTSPGQCEAAFIGSLLDDFLFKGIPWLNQSYRSCYNMPPVKIWGTGFIAAKNMFCKRLFNLPEQYFRKIEVFSVRGKSSKDRLQDICGKDLSDVLLADAGLLASELYTKRDKKFSVGIIPHHLENDVKLFSKLNDNIPHSILLNMEWEPRRILQAVSECEYIISSALHGLIVADSMGIPNIQVVASNRLIGGMYKFDDYYSSYGISNRKLFTEDINLTKVTTFIEENYQVRSSDVEEKKKKLFQTFPYRK